jgi:phage terminase large subunit
MPRSKPEAIAAARAALARGQFDEQRCSLGLRRLRAYRTELPDGVEREPGGVERGPRHDDASHGADAFLTFACSNYSPPPALPTRKRSFGWVV